MSDSNQNGGRAAKAYKVTLSIDSVAVEEAVPTAWVELYYGNV
jgi:hypothetical protein